MDSADSASPRVVIERSLFSPRVDRRITRTTKRRNGCESRADGPLQIEEEGWSGERACRGDVDRRLARFPEEPPPAGSFCRCSLGHSSPSPGWSTPCKASIPNGVATYWCSSDPCHGSRSWRFSPGPGVAITHPAIPVKEWVLGDLTAILHGLSVTFLARTDAAEILSPEHPLMRSVSPLSAGTIPEDNARPLGGTLKGAEDVKMPREPRGYLQRHPRRGGRSPDFNGRGIGGTAIRATGDGRLNALTARPITTTLGTVVLATGELPEEWGGNCSGTVRTSLRNDNALGESSLDPAKIFSMGASGNPLA